MCIFLWFSELTMPQLAQITTCRLFDPGHYLTQHRFIVNWAHDINFPWHEIRKFPYREMNLKMSSTKWLPIFIPNKKPWPSNARLFRLENSSLLEGKTVNYACSCCFCGVVAFTNSAQSIIAIRILSVIALATNICLKREVFNLLEYNKMGKGFRI